MFTLWRVSLCITGEPARASLRLSDADVEARKGVRSTHTQRRIARHIYGRPATEERVDINTTTEANCNLRGSDTTIVFPIFNDTNLIIEPLRICVTAIVWDEIFGGARGDNASAVARALACDGARGFVMRALLIVETKPNKNRRCFFGVERSTIKWQGDLVAPPGNCRVNGTDHRGARDGTTYGHKYQGLSLRICSAQSERTK